MSHAELNESGGSIRRAFAAVGRAFGWGVLCATCGVILGFTNGVIHAPPDVPGQPLANEWYPVGVILIMFVECIVGFFIGVGIALGVQPPTRRRKVFAFILGGSAVGVGLGWVLARIFQVVLIDWRDGSELVSNLFLQATGAFCGMIFAVWRQVAVLKPPHFGGAADA